ncbi:MAG: hypothetical protein LUE11_09730 [Clostridia bacterium]|nr:hypothetical protein [Clostridia bacterium]
MKEKKLLRTIGDIDQELIAEADGIRVKKRKYGWITAAVCAILMIAAGYAVWFGKNTPQNQEPAAEWQLEHSAGDIRVTEITDPPEMGGSSLLAYMTEDELVTQNDTSIFRGTVENIQNICVTSGDGAYYYGIITINVREIYRDLGGCEAGQKIRILTDPIHLDGVGTEDMDVIKQVQTGMEGIFIARAYAENETYELDNGLLFWTDLADCELPDGIRYAFLQMDGYVLYDKNAYPSVFAAEPQDLEGQTLDDVAAVIEKMLQK